MSDVDWSIDDEGKLLSIDFPKERLAIDAEGLDGLIAFLGSIRNRMQPQNAASLKDTVKGSAWSVELEPETKQVLVHLEHSMVGWLHFSFTNRDAETLAGLLLTPGGK